MSKMTVRSLRRLKGQRPIVAISLYDTVFALWAAQAEPDLLLVGDSLSTAAMGHDSTVPTTLDAMVYHTAAVARARPQALLVADLPFAEVGFSMDRLIASCQRLMQEGQAEAIKLEGGQAFASKVAELVTCGIPVLGHIGLLPQHVHALGGYRKFGKTDAERQHLLADAQALEAAGAFALVLELVDAETTQTITQNVEIPTIGIGCGSATDGQILVGHDILGLTHGHYPAFAKTYAQLGQQAATAFKEYANEVRQHQFPS